MTKRQRGRSEKTAALASVSLVITENGLPNRLICRGHAGNPGAGSFGAGPGVWLLSQIPRPFADGIVG
jgi:hypothetical protein